MVGAAGFEPATCSTQNCRATRMRYPPPVAAFGYMVRPPPASRTACRPCADHWPLPKIEPTTRSPGLMPSRRAVPAITSSHARRSAGREEAIRFRLGALFDAHDPAVAANENHIQRDVGIVHPERDRLVMLEVEQHALAFRALLAGNSGPFA